MTVDANGAIHGTHDGRFAGRVQLEGDLSLLGGTELTLAEQRQAEVFAHLVGNTRLPLGYMSRFSGGQVHEQAAVAAVLADSDLYQGRRFDIDSTGTQVIVSAQVPGGGMLMELVPSPPAGRHGMVAAGEYAATLDPILSRMDATLRILEDHAVTAPTDATPAALPAGPGPGDEQFTTEFGTFTMASEPEDVPGTCYALAFRCDKPISDEDMDRFAQLAGYAWRSTVNGESLGRPVRVNANTFAISADSTKGNGTTWDFFDKLPGIVSDGTPVRKTDRSGEGTRGTRLVDGLHTSRFDIYFG